MNTRKSFIIFSIILPVMTLLSLYIYYEYVQTKNKIFHIIKEHFINEKMVSFDNYIKHIAQKHPLNLQKIILKNKTLALNLEKKLQLVQGKDVKFLYILYKDSHGSLRYLIDTTQDKKNKAKLNQKFHAVSNIWDKAYKTQKNQYTYQNELESLWITLACPIVVNNKVVAILGADFTYSIYNEILLTLKPMQNMFIYISIFIIIMLIVAYILVYMYYLMHKKSIIDPLTKVYNRQYLTEFLENISLKEYYILMLDIDHFKKVNDNYGHNIGDLVLIKVTEKLSSIVRTQDTIIRFGGEEFVLFIHKENGMGPLKVANRIRIAIQKMQIEMQDQILNITVSIGVNPLPTSTDTIEEAIKIADEQLYIAKSLGRNIVKIYEED